MVNFGDAMGALNATSTSYFHVAENPKGQSYLTYEKGKSPFETLQKDVHQQVLQPNLPLSVIGRLAQVSKKLKEIHQPTVNKALNQLKNMTLGPEQWKAAILKGRELLNPDQQEKFVEIIDQLLKSLNEAPSLPKGIDSILKAPCPFNQGKRVEETHRLVLMPSKISINLLGALMQYLKTEYNNDGTIFRASWEEFLRQKGDETIEKPYWALVTRDVIPDSRNKNFEDQEKLFEKHPEYGCPSVLEAIALTTMHLECSGENKEYLLPKNPWIYTRCRDVFNNWHLEVGAFAPSGLSVGGSYGHARDNRGVLAVRKFS